MKSKGGNSQRIDRKNKEDQARERVRRKKMQMHKKAEKSRNIFCFHCFVAKEGRKVGLLEPVGRMRDQPLHGVVVRICAKHISKSKCVSNYRTSNQTILGSLLEVEMLQERTALWREAHFEGKKAQSTPFSGPFL